MEINSNSFGAFSMFGEISGTIKKTVEEKKNSQDLSDLPKTENTGFLDSLKTSSAFLYEETKKQNITKESFKKSNTDYSPSLVDISPSICSSRRITIDSSEDSEEEENEQDITSPKGGFTTSTIQKVNEQLFHKTGKIKIQEEEISMLLDPFAEEQKKLKIVACTFNVAEGISETVGDWIASNPADIYTIGLQEIDMSAKTIVSAKSDACKNWDKIFQNTFEKNGEFKKIISEQLVGMYHCLYIHKSHYQKIENAYWSKIGLGKLGLGNKGCIAYTLQLFGNTFCFVNSHFESGKKKIKERNQNFQYIYSEKLFDNSEISPLDANFVIFVGDFNYRIQLSKEETEEIIKTKNVKKLLNHDQLSLEKDEGNVFDGFFEPEITFLPTYKFDKNSNIYDTSKKQRVPSYCDRILIKC
eukprot:gene8988-1087_t